jgi:hypothetical protein
MQKPMLAADLERSKDREVPALPRPFPWRIKIGCYLIHQQFIPQALIA